MLSVFRFRFLRTFRLLIFAGSAFFVGGYGVLLLVEIFKGHRSSGGNVLLFVLVSTFLLVSVSALIVGSLFTLVKVLAQSQHY